MRSRAFRWGRRLLVGGVGTAGLAYGGFTMWVRSYDQGLAGPPREVRVLVDDHGNLLDSDLEVARWRVWFRFVELFFLYLPLFLSYPLTYVHPYFDNLWTNHLVNTLQASGPTFIKLAQWLATRRDLLGAEARQILARLFNRVDPHSFAYTKQRIAHEFGDFDELFEWMEETPLGSGSIAQVHKAKLRTGEIVAVKVCHPRVRERIAIDFHVLNYAAKMVDAWFPSLRWMLLPRMAISWTTHLAQQIDLRIEAENLDYFLQNFEGADTDRFATFPKPLRPYVSSTVLVEQFVDAHTADDDYLHSLPMDLRTHLAEVGMDTYMKFLLRDNWLHGDLHPGNIMIEKDPPPGKKWPRVYLVDCGLCQNLTPEEKGVAEQVLVGFAKWKADALTDALWAMGKDGQQREEVSKDELRETIKDVFDYYQACKGDDNAIVGRLLEAMFDVARVHKLQFEPGYTSLLFGVLVQENFIMTLDDRFNIIKRVIPWLAGQGIVSQGMFKNFTNFYPEFLKTEDKKEKLGPKLESMGLLGIEGGNHQSFEEERQGGGREEWRKGILDATTTNGK
eukprot:TRINITY_DN23998_c0_g1_i1.p1 TRINITY_DN23998_c0_g1~~TRINITY_DN23998_c0_g1_i1.p1  ORF type:complete len:562 (+),score=220.03 TRINITY_DN23998_c0_g1_i1:46-1731(+)